LPFKGASLSVCLLAALLSGCSRAEPTSRDFVLADQPPVKTEETGNTLEAAKKACKEETKRKGIMSVAAVVSRLRPGKLDDDYIACMKARGYEPGS
jgi:hypothetical protein